MLLQAAEHRRVFGHRRGDAGGRLLEVARRSGCGNRRRSPASRARRAACLSKPTAANTAPSGWQALAGLTVSASRAKFFSRYSLLLVQSRISLDLRSREWLNSKFASCRRTSPGIPARGTASFVVDDCSDLGMSIFWRHAMSSPWTPRQAVSGERLGSGGCRSFHGRLGQAQTGVLIAMSMSRAKMAKPS